MRRVAGLLRAINVGGRKLLMTDLIRISTTAGLDKPQTLLASGNVMFGTEHSNSEAERQLEAAILKDQGLATDVMVRDLAELRAVVSANPFPLQAVEAPGRLLVLFLKGEPVGDLDGLTSACALGEEVRPGPGCLYLWYPQGVGVSKLTNAVIERRVGVPGTARNWNTVGKLVERLMV